MQGNHLMIQRKLVLASALGLLADSGLHSEVVATGLRYAHAPVQRSYD